MATPTLKYVAPTTPEDELTFAPEPVVIYGVPSGGGGGGAVDSVNGQTGVVELAVADIPGLQTELDSKADNSEVVELAGTVQTALTNIESDLDSKAATTYVDNQLGTKASATDLDNVFTVATDAQSDATAALSGLSAKVNTADVAGLNTVGWARAVWIASGGTAPVGTPAYTIVIEA